MTGKPSIPGTFRTGYLAARRCTHSSRSTRETSPRSSCVRTAFKTGGCRTFSRRNPPHSTGLLGSVRAAKLLWSFGTSGRQSRRQSARQDDRVILAATARRPRGLGRTSRREGLHRSLRRHRPTHVEPERNAERRPGDQLRQTGPRSCRRTTPTPPGRRRRGPDGESAERRWAVTCSTPAARAAGRRGSREAGARRQSPRPRRRLARPAAPQPPPPAPLSLTAYQQNVRPPRPGGQAPTFGVTGLAPILLL